MLWLVSLGKFLLSGPLDRVLSTVDHKIDNETEREKIKAEVTKTWANNRAQVLVQRTWWFQLFFVVPLGFWFAAVVVDSVFLFEWDVAALPPPLDQWGGWIITSLFLINGADKVAGTIRRRG